MDFKTNTLTKELEVNESLLPEITGLLFGSLREEQVVFDYTAYLEANQLEMIDYKTFMRTNKHYIENIIKMNGHKTSDLFYQNTNGHILVASELVFLFLAFVNPEMCMYFNNLIGDVLTSGVAYSDGFAYSMAADRVPTDVLQEIIKERNINETRGKQ